MTSLDLLDVLLDPDMGGGTYEYDRIAETMTAAGLPEYSEERGSFDGNIQPAPGKERELLPEEDMLRSAIVIYSPEDLSSGGNGRKADRVWYRGDAYRVALAEPWREHAGYTKALAVLERPGEEATP